MSNKNSPLFITGGWRSGTTLLSRVFNNHSEMSVTYDTIHFMRFLLNEYNPINNKKNVIKLLTDTRSRIKERYGLELVVDEVLELIGDKYEYPNIYNSIMQAFLLNKTGKSIWGEKTNLAWNKIPEFFDMFPDGRVVHIIRDPRAVLASWKKFTNAPGNDYLDSIINTYDSMEKMHEYAIKYNDKRYAFLKYEDLVESPENTLREICKKIEIEFDIEMLNVNSFKDLNNNPWQANTIRNIEIRGISTDVVDKWKEELRPWEIYLCEIILSKMLDLFGYKKMNIEINEHDINHTVQFIMESELSNHGLLYFLLAGRGIERYPSDPKIKENWAK